MRLIALDPGGTTGVASYTDEPKPPDTEFIRTQIGPEQHHEKLFDLLRYGLWNAIICERFEYRNTSRAGLVLASKEYIGVVNLVNQMTHTPVVFQNASQAKGFVRDKNLRRLGLYRTGQPHAMDATRHLLLYMINQDSPQKADLLSKGWSNRD